MILTGCTIPRVIPYGLRTHVAREAHWGILSLGFLLVALHTETGRGERHGNNAVMMSQISRAAPPMDMWVPCDCSGTDDVMLCPEWIEGMVENRGGLKDEPVFALNPRMKIIGTPKGIAPNSSRAECWSKDD